MMYTAASFFSGIGGLDLAFAWAGFDVRVQVEIDDYCRKVLWKNRNYWKNAKQFKDIRHVTKSKVGQVDVMFGGFPCQDISIAGKRAGITKQTRSGLWFEFLRLIRQVRPRVIVLENVAAIHFPTSDDDGYKQPSPGLVVTASLSEIGYDAIWLPIRAADIGAPHQRERWFCVAIRMDNGCSVRRRRTPAPRRYTRNRKRYIKKEQRTTKQSAPQSANKILQFQHRSSGKPKRNSRGRPKREVRNASCATGWEYRAQSRLGRVAHGIPRRVDRHRGQFPARPNESQFDFEPSRVTGRRDHRSDRLKALGNAVVPQQALPIAMTVKAFLDN